MTKVLLSHPPRPASHNSSRAMVWVRKNLFSSWSNSLLTIGCIWLMWELIPPLLNWAFLQANWVGSTRTDCTKAGACWVFIHERFGQFMYGLYPHDQRWRINLALLIGLVSIAPMFWKILPHRGRYIAVWAVIYPLIVWWLINTMTTRHNEVISCQSWRFVLCGVAGFLVSVGLPWMVDLFGQGNAARGYQLGVGVLCAIAVVMFLCCFFWVRERVPLSTMGKFTLREHLAGLRNNDQLLLMLVMSFLLINVFNIRGGGYMYFITYVLQGSTGYTSLFFTMVTFASIIGSVIVSPLTRRFDTVKIYYYTNLLLAALAVLMWFLPSGPAYQTLWLAVILGNGVILGFTLPLHFSLMAFADDYGEWKTRVRSSGMNFAFNLFFIKLAWASSAGIISLLFIFVAYQPGVENQTASSLGGITAMETLLPALFHLLLAMAIRFCKLNNPMMSRIASDLRQRHVQP